MKEMESCRRNALASLLEDEGGRIGVGEGESSSSV
jgi:hypothetical protein